MAAPEETRGSVEAELERGRQALERGEYRTAIDLIGAVHAERPSEATSYWLSQATYQATQAFVPDPMTAEPGRVVDYVELLLLVELDLANAIARLSRTPDYDDERATLHHRLAWVRRAVRDQVRFARARMRWDRDAAIDTLDRLFELGHPPREPLDGFYRGQLVTITLAVGVDRIMNGLARKYMPWRGKLFDAGRRGGTNVFAAGSRRLVGWFFPGYTGWREAPVARTGEASAPAATTGTATPVATAAPPPGTLCAFDFTTVVGRGAVDPVDVLKIDYDLPENPPDLRRLLDELVELSSGFYLGKVHVFRRDGRLQTVGYFSLSA